MAGLAPLAIGRPARSDHYYWLTAMLAARGMQVAVCRLIAGLLLGMALISVALIAAGGGPRGAAAVWSAVGVSAACVVMSTLWLRPRWPTRETSAACALLGNVLVSLSCLIQSDPLTGLFGLSATIVVSAFAALFHDLRILIATWLAASVAVVAIGVRMPAEFGVVRTAAWLALTVIVNVFVAFTSRIVSRLVDVETRIGDIEPLTGLLTRDSYYENTALLLGARSRVDDRFLVVVTVSLDQFSLLRSVRGEADADRARVAIAQRLREAVRRETVLAHVGDSEFLVAEPFTGADPEPLVERLLGTVRTAPYRMTASIGVVSTPLVPLAGRSPVDVCDELLTIASSAMYEARLHGGNRARYVIAPKLAVLDDGPDERRADTA